MGLVVPQHRPGVGSISELPEIQVFPLSSFIQGRMSTSYMSGTVQCGSEDEQDTESALEGLMV